MKPSLTFYTHVLNVSLGDCLRIAVSEAFSDLLLNTRNKITCSYLWLHLNNMRN